MIRQDIVRRIASKRGIDSETIQTVLLDFFEIVKESLRNQDPVYLRGFGTFLVKHRKSKKARDIRKNTTVVIPERDVASFKPSSDFTL